MAHQVPTVASLTVGQAAAEVFRLAHVWEEFFSFASVDAQTAVEARGRERRCGFSAYHTAFVVRFCMFGAASRSLQLVLWARVRMAAGQSRQFGKWSKVSGDERLRASCTPCQVLGSEYAFERGCGPSGRVAASHKVAICTKQKGGPAFFACAEAAAKPPASYSLPLPSRPDFRLGHTFALFLRRASADLEGRLVGFYVSGFLFGVDFENAGLEWLDYSFLHAFVCS